MDFKSGGPLHRYSALLILVFSLYLVVSILVSIFSLQAQAKQDYEDAQFQLKKYQAMVASQDLYEAENQSLTAMMVNDSHYHIAEDQSLAIAEFQQDLRQLIQQSGAKLISMQSDKGNAENGILPVTMKLHLRLNDEVLVKVLHQLEGRQPVGFVYNLNINRQTSRGKKRSNEERLTLDTHIEYTTFMDKQDDS
jgi:Type II secretion system (T2SS), protein M subtype b